LPYEKVEGETRQDGWVKGNKLNEGTSQDIGDTDFDLSIVSIIMKAIRTKPASTSMDNVNWRCCSEEGINSIAACPKSYRRGDKALGPAKDSY